MLSGDGPAASVKGSTCFSEKTGHFSAPAETPLFSGHSGHLAIVGSRDRLLVVGFLRIF
jgi:hypothetical protein